MTMHTRQLTAAVAAMALACSPADRSTKQHPGGQPPAGPMGGVLTGAGATFPNPIYTKWFDVYARETGVRINYQSIGSGGGIRQFTEGTVDFGATDSPMTDAQIAAVKGNVRHIPTVLGAVAVTYNLPSLGSTSLRFDGTTLADVFLGRITRWNDRRIAALNPGVALPADDIIVAHRSDGSGTSYIFTDYLAKISTEWQEQVGHATSVKWPTGLGGKGNEGVTQVVKQSEGSVGYVELVYAISNGLPVARLQNATGAFVEPTLESVTAAAASASLGPDTDFRVSITNPPGADAYPISSFTWLLLPKVPRSAENSKALEDFVRWMLTPTPQHMAAELHYAPLPATVIELVQKRLGPS